MATPPTSTARVTPTGNQPLAIAAMGKRSTRGFLYRTPTRITGLLLLLAGYVAAAVYCYMHVNPYSLVVFLIIAEVGFALILVVTALRQKLRRLAVASSKIRRR